MATLTLMNQLIGALQQPANVPDRSLDALAAKLTDLLATTFLCPHIDSSSTCFAMFAEIQRVTQIASAKVSPPEGFAYYALHPSQFADPFPDRSTPASAAIVGIRTIGTTLSAVSAASLRLRGWNTSRITVRPQGDPYNRVAQFSPEQHKRIQSALHDSGAFIVVDEGPGLSGSSLLSVAEALENAGVPAHRITLLGTRQPDPDALYASNATQRWSRFHWRCTSSTRYCDISGSPCKPQHLLKFDGLGRFGNTVRERAELLCHAGFGPKPTKSTDGLTQYDFVSGTPLTRSDISLEVLETIARYCAFRAREFHTSRTPEHNLRSMALLNCALEFSLEPDLREESFFAESPIIPDGRMLPHEWIRTPDGQLCKTDAGSHGDDHFFPGPTDIAWDLAGTIVEWDLSPAQATFLIARYTKISGDDPSARLPDFVVAYAVFRQSFCYMASLAVSDPRERSRLQAHQRVYRAKLQSILRSQPTRPGRSIA
ncbi:MAG: hypothetical protein DMG81_20325 [Acidobacteria bacterium]|nr:MAG: hypothetical protein DMG81_20325 [Acidobacteriota bacterium]